MDEAIQDALGDSDVDWALPPDMPGTRPAFHDRNDLPAALPPDPPEPGPAESVDRPDWDDHSSVLWFRGQVVLRLHRRAPNQRTVLAALQVKRWPPFIDDPVEPGQPKDGKTRLKQTVRDLNKQLRLRSTSLRFTQGSGGATVGWTSDKQA